MAGNSLEGKKIIWIEDDNFLGGLIAKKLTNEGADVSYVSSGEQALQKMEDTTPDFILSDILLPGLTGFDILEKVKADERLKDVPVILFSNLSQEEDIERGVKLGAEAFLVKSNVVPDQIVSKIKDIILSKQ